MDTILGKIVVLIGLVAFVVSLTIQIIDSGKYELESIFLLGTAFGIALGIIVYTNVLGE